MERLTKKDLKGRYYTVAEEVGISDKKVNPITNWIEDFENRSYGNPIDKLGRLEDIEEEIGCPIEEMAIICKIAKNGYIYEDEDKNTFQIGLELEFDFENHELVLYNEYDDDFLGHWEEVGRFKITDYKKKYWLKGDKSE